MRVPWGANTSQVLETFEDFPVGASSGARAACQAHLLWETKRSGCESRGHLVAKPGVRRRRGNEIANCSQAECVCGPRLFPGPHTLLRAALQPWRGSLASPQPGGPLLHVACHQTGVANRSGNSRVSRSFPLHFSNGRRAPRLIALQDVGFRPVSCNAFRSFRWTQARHPLRRQTIIRAARLRWGP
jgi:hypothetical protein